MAQFVYTMHRVGKVVPPKREILKDISLSFFPGAKIGVLGLNGSGKSSLLRIMAGIDKDHHGEARAQSGINIGYLPQEPALNPDKDVRGNVEEAMGPVLKLIEDFNAISDRFAEPMSDDEMNDLLEKRANCRTRSTPQKDGIWSASSKSLPMRCACRPGMLMSARSLVVKKDVWRCAACCCPIPTCCCWTNPPTTWTPRASAGSSVS